MSRLIIKKLDDEAFNIRVEQELGNKIPISKVHLVLGGALKVELGVPLDQMDVDQSVTLEV